MKLTCEMKFNEVEINDAVKTMAERCMPQVPGYTVEVEFPYTYHREAIARLVPIQVAEEITIEPVEE